MIELYTWGTPNGQKASIMLEECGLPFNVHPVNITKDEQFAPDFLKISPNNKIPAIVDTDTGYSVFESGAILIYLAEKAGRFLPAEPKLRYQTLEWLMFRWAAWGRCSARRTTSCASTPARRPTPRSATATRRSGSTA
jgi:GST-like protein